MKTSYTKGQSGVFAWLILIILLNFNHAAHAQKVMAITPNSFQPLTWLEGKWQRTNITRPNRTGFEVWKKISENEFKGTGYTLQGTDTLFVEKLRILLVGSEVHYVADVPENQNPVHFTFTALTNQSFVCENPDHDYPKKISYELKSDTLKAITSGNGKQQLFLFVRSK